MGGGPSKPHRQPKQDDYVAFVFKNKDLKDPLSYTWTEHWWTGKDFDKYMKKHPNMQERLINTGGKTPYSVRYKDLFGATQQTTRHWAKPSMWEEEVAEVPTHLKEFIHIVSPKKPDSA